MFAAYLQGAMISGGLIMAIGAQNAFLLKQGLLKQYVFWVALICFLCDFALISLGVFSVGGTLNRNPMVTALLSLAGAVFLFWFGLRSFKAMLSPKHAALLPDSDAAAHSGSLKAAVMTTLAVTLLNPQVYLETVMVIGGMAAPLNGVQKLWFLAGAVSASFTWFFGVGYGARLLQPLFANPRAWQILEGVTAAIMWWLCWGLARFV